MTAEERDPQEEGPPRPRVVDKRVTARGASPSAEPARDPGTTPSPPFPAPTPEPSPAPEPGSAPPAGAVAPQTGVWTPEQEAEAQRLAHDIAATPSLEWVVNVAVTLANVAGTKIDLGQGGDAGLAIDALAGLLNSVGDRLGSAEQPLRQTLAQLQLAYASRIAGPPPAGPG